MMQTRRNLLLGLLGAAAFPTIALAQDARPEGERRPGQGEGERREGGEQRGQSERQGQGRGESQGQNRGQGEQRDGQGRQEQRGRTGGAVVVDVDNRYAAHAHWIQRALAAGGITIHVADVGLLEIGRAHV